jgi:dTDP-4-dehydrorhamnose reductase
LEKKFSTAFCQEAEVGVKWKIQRRRPTAAADIAAALIVIAEHIERGEAKWDTYHFAGARAVTWYGFAETIFNLAASQLAACPQIEAITTDQYPTPARRPMNSVLDRRKIEAVFGIHLSPWCSAKRRATGVAEGGDPSWPPNPVATKSASVGFSAG